MFLEESSLVDDAMTAIKEELVNDLAESVNEMNSDKYLEVTTR